MNECNLLNISVSFLIRIDFNSKKMLTSLLEIEFSEVNHNNNKNNDYYLLSFMY